MPQKRRGDTAEKVFESKLYITERYDSWQCAMSQFLF